MSLIHRTPQLLDGGTELVRICEPDLLDGYVERLIGKELHVLCEHGEDAPDEESSDRLLVMPSPLQRAGELREALRNLLGDGDGAGPRVACLGVGPDVPQELDVLGPIPRGSGGRSSARR